MPGFYLVASVIVSKTNSTYDFFLFFTKVCVCNGYFGIAMSHLLCKKNACDVCVCVCVGGGVKNMLVEGELTINYDNISVHAFGVAWRTTMLLVQTRWAI